MTRSAQAKQKEKGKFTVSEVPTVEAPNFTMNWTDLKSSLPIEQLTVKRVYWINNVKGKGISGQHFHKDDENEIFFVTQGTGIAVIDDGKGLRDVSLRRNSIMWVPRLTWHGFKKMSRDFTIVALTTTNYDPDRKGYETNYQDFQKLERKVKK